MPYGKIRQERQRQDELWGEQNHAPLYWVAVLVEEVGEMAKSVLEENWPEYHTELVQIGVVAVAALESYARGSEL